MRCRDGHFGWALIGRMWGSEERVTTTRKSSLAIGHWPLVIVLLAFALRLYRLDFQSLWWDEGHSVDMASAALAAIPTLPGMDVHPPLYFWLLHLWMAVAGRSEFALRFLSVCFGVATVALLYRMGRAMGGAGLGRLAAGIGALAPFWLAYSQEVRMYTMVTFLGGLSGYFLWAGLRGRRHEWRGRDWTWPLYVLSTAAALYTHYFAGFVLIFENVAWLWWAIRPPAAGPARRRLARWLATQAGVLALLAPQLYTATRQVTAYKNVNLVPPTLGFFVQRCWQAFTVGLAFPPAWALAAAAGIAVVIVVGLGLRFAGPFGSLRAGRGDSRVDGGTVAFLAAWFALPLAVYFVVLQRRPSFEPRYVMLVTPPLYLLLACALHASRTTRHAPRKGQKSSRRLVRLIPCSLFSSVVLAAFLVGLRTYFFDPAFFKDDTRGLARFVEAEAGPRDVVYIDVPHPFGYYYHGAAPGRYLFVDVHTVDRVLTEECQGRERLFWIRWRQSDTDPRGVVLYLLDKYGQRLGQRRFRGYDVVWYRLPSPARFAVAPAFEPVDVDFGGQVRLVGRAFGGRGQEPTASEAEVEARRVPAGRRAWAALQWRATGAAGDYKASLYLRDERGHMVGQVDKALLNDRHLHTSAWGPDDVAINVYNLPVAPGTPPGRYTLEAAVYAPESLRRLDVLDAAGTPQGTTAPLGTLEVVRPDEPPSPDALGMAHTLGLDLGPEITLLGYDRGGEVVNPGQTLPLTLYWRARRDVAGDYLIGVGLGDDASRLVNEVRGRPVGGAYPTTEWVAGEIVRDWADLPIAAGTPPGSYRLMVTLLDAATGQPLGQADLGPVTVAGRPRTFDVPPIPHPSSANFGGQIELLGYETRNTQYAIRVTLYWQALTEVPTSYTVFVHLLDAGGQVRGQHDGLPVGGTYPTTGWLPGEVVADEHEIEVEPGRYQLEVGLYDAATMQRLPVVDGDGQPQGDRVLLGEMAVE